MISVSSYQNKIDSMLEAQLKSQSMRGWFVLSKA